MKLTSPALAVLLLLALCAGVARAAVVPAEPRPGSATAATLLAATTPSVAASAVPPASGATPGTEAEPPQPVPLPGAFPLLLFAMGLFSMARSRRR